MALLHDVGAYRTEEIDRMVAFETESVWEHSFYGYLFFKELTPLGAYADVICTTTCLTIGSPTKIRT